jgi:hypothetical protein
MNRTTDKPNKKYLESICDELIEFQKNKGFGVMYVKTEELGRKETESVQNIEIEESQETIRVDQKEML